MIFPTLYYKAKGGALIQWEVQSSGGIIQTTWGQVGGKMQTSVKLAEVKNVGRSNATTKNEQAYIEAHALYEHKLKRKYSRTKAEAQEVLFLPMLAHDYKKHHNGLRYPVSIQPKLDGFRCLAKKENGVVTLISRSGDEFDLPHITKELNDVLSDNTVLDGELYCHGVPFQKVASWIKKQHPYTINIGYHVYDLPEISGESGFTWIDRLTLLDVLDKGTPDKKHFSIVETDQASTKEDVFKWQLKYIEAGYEGAIVRVNSALYQYGFRSHGLLKVKTFDDDEFLITGGGPGRGKTKDQCIFECTIDPKDTSKNKRFNVMPRGTAKERSEYLTNLPALIGKYLKVKYFGKSEDDIPRFPIGLGIREDFDTSKKRKK